MIFKKSLEAIDRQKDGLFKELTLAVAELREHPDRISYGSDNRSLSSIIKQHTNVDVEIQLPYTKTQADAIRVTRVSLRPLVNGPVWDQRQHEIVKTIASTRLNVYFPQGFNGSIDRKNNTVSGDFTKIKTTIFIGSLYITDWFMKPEHVAAIILHELGHIFNAFEYVGDMFTTNMVMYSLLGNITKTNDLKERQVVIKATLNHINSQMSDTDINKLAEKDNKVVVSVVLSKIGKLKSISGSDRYDITASEQSADQYATRCGAGVALAESFAIVERLIGLPVFKKAQKMAIASDISLITEKHLSARAMSPFVAATMDMAAIFIMYWMWLTILMLICSVIYHEPDGQQTDLEGLYDEPIIRVKRIREDVINQMKANDKGKDYYKQLVEEVKSLDNVIAQYDENPKWYDGISRAIWGRQAKKARDMEMIAANDLFFHAHDLEVNYKK